MLDEKCLNEILYVAKYGGAHCSIRTVKEGRVDSSCQTRLHEK